MRVFLLLLLSPSVFNTVYDIIFYYIPIMSGDFSALGAEFIIYTATINAFSIFFLVYLIKNKKLTKKPKTQFEVPLHYYYIFFGVTLFFYAFLVVSVFDAFNLVEVFNNYGRFYALSKRGTSWVFSIFSMISSTILFDFYFNGVKRSKLIIYIAILLVIALTGGRATIITYLIIVVFIHNVIHKNKLNIILMLTSIAIVSGIFILNSALRHGVDINKYLSEEKSNFDFNQAFIFEDTVNFIHNSNETFFLVDLLEIKYMFIPRSFWEDKPYSTVATRLVFPEIGDRGTSITFGLYGNAYLNMGILTFAYIPILFFIWNYFYFIAATSRKLKASYFILLLFSVIPTQVIRGGSIDLRLLRIIIPIIMSYYLYKLISKKYHN